MYPSPGWDVTALLLSSYISLLDSFKTYIDDATHFVYSVSDLICFLDFPPLSLHLGGHRNRYWLELPCYEFCILPHLCSLFRHLHVSGLRNGRRHTHQSHRIEVWSGYGRDQARVQSSVQPNIGKIHWGLYHHYLMKYAACKFKVFVIFATIWALHQKQKKKVTKVCKTWHKGASLCMCFLWCNFFAVICFMCIKFIFHSNMLPCEKMDWTSCCFTCCFIYFIIFLL